MPCTSIAMADTDEGVWIETATETGDVYYYHNLTQETSWERPEDGTVVRCLLQCSTLPRPLHPPHRAPSCERMKSKSSMKLKRVGMKRWKQSQSWL